MIPPIFPGGSIAPREPPIEALHDVNALLEITHELKSMAEHGSQEEFLALLKQQSSDIQKTSEDLEKRLTTLQRVHPQAYKIWKEELAPEMQHLDSLAALSSFCDTLQKVHDLLLF